MTIRFRQYLFCLLSLVLLGCFFSFPNFRQPYPQDLTYHQFADQRRFLCLPHCLNVLSNLPFLLVGIWGLIWMANNHQAKIGTAFLDPAERLPFWVFFAGLALTGLGSAYYHADPTNERLVWDRLPLAVAFMALFTSVLAERLNVRLTGLLIPLTLLGGGSVIYWGWTEAAGHGDLRPYFLVQFFPLVALPLLLLLFPPRYTRTSDLVASLACYLVAKVLELADGAIYHQGQLVSGHTLKHLVAGWSGYLVLHMLQRRRGWKSHSPGGPLAGRGPRRQ